MNAEKLIPIMRAIAARIEKEKDYLTELDNVIGDGDHGINMARGFKVVETKLDGLKTPADVFKTVGMTLVSTVGGASGPLYGTAFMKMAQSVNGKEEIGMEDFLPALRAAIDGISMRGRSKQGEKTMLDAMIPAAEAMEKAVTEGKSAKEALEAGVSAAWAGVEITKTYAATKGRASYVGDRSIGHQDPGATSFTQMLEEVAGGIA